MHLFFGADLKSSVARKKCGAKHSPFTSTDEMDVLDTSIPICAKWHSESFFHRFLNESGETAKIYFCLDHEASLGPTIASNGRVTFWGEAFEVVRRPVLGLSPLIFCPKMDRFF